MSKKEIKLLVFYWDGTVVDSEWLIVNTLQAAIKQHNRQEPRTTGKLAEGNRN
jgi:phosphoglycolate phosphatase-like HAD superfamily hydrolase